jgi:hypothetical protein
VDDEKPLRRQYRFTFNGWPDIGLLGSRDGHLYRSGTQIVNGVNDGDTPNRRHAGSISTMMSLSRLVSPRAWELNSAECITSRAFTAASFSRKLVMTSCFSISLFYPKRAALEAQNAPDLCNRIMQQKRPIRSTVWFCRNILIFAWQCTALLRTFKFDPRATLVEVDTATALGALACRYSWPIGR